MIRDYFAMLCPNTKDCAQLANYISNQTGEQFNTVYQRLRIRSSRPNTSIALLERDLDILGYKIEIMPK